MIFIKEIWKDVAGYEGLYKVSNLGRVKSLPRFHKIKSKGYITKEKILKNITDYTNYLKVYLYKNSKSKMYQVHRLVALAFIPNPNNYPEVNHKKEFEKHNNRVDNLEWCTKKYNINYGTHTERSAKLHCKKVYQYSKEGKFIREWESAMECTKFGFNNSVIGKCCSKKPKFKSHKGYKWSYEKKIILD